jgi:hypothetical protein
MGETGKSHMMNNVYTVVRLAHIYNPEKKNTKHEQTVVATHIHTHTSAEDI